MNQPSNEILTEAYSPKSSLPAGLEDGIALVLKAEEEGRSSDLADWIASHPALAGYLAEFLAGQRGIRSAAVKAIEPISKRSSMSDGPLVVGGVELFEEIGRGGMGVVYRGFDPVLKRMVAIKRVLCGTLTSPDEMARFRFEAEAAAGLDHAGVVPIHSFGETDGQPYLVMPFMEGGSLAQRLHELGPDRCLAPREAARLIRDVALGVHHAHQRGLLHRDLKPGNILLDREGHPRVADFGLALTLEASYSLSLSRGMAGTAAYMAPEQASGEKGLTTAVDIHALGAILFELLIGSPPFGQGDWLQTLQRVRDESAPSVRRKRADVPRDLESICLNCLEKNPRDRYPSAMVLAEELTRYLEGEPLGSKRPGWMVWLTRVLGRRRETLAMSTWPGCLAMAAVMVFTHGLVQFVVLNGASGWWSYFFLGLTLVGWLGLFVWFLVIQAHRLSTVERFSAALQLGSILACLALVPAQLQEFGPDILPFYPPLTVVLGLGLFAHGATHWGKLYIAGALLLALGGGLPWLPRIIWPTVHGASFALVLIWTGFQLRSFDIESRSIFQRRPLSPGSGP